MIETIIDMKLCMTRCVYWISILSSSGLMHNIYSIVGASANILTCYLDLKPINAPIICDISLLLFIYRETIHDYLLDEYKPLATLVAIEELTFARSNRFYTW